LSRGLKLWPMAYPRLEHSSEHWIASACCFKYFQAIEVLFASNEDIAIDNVVAQELQQVRVVLCGSASTDAQTTCSAYGKIMEQGIFLLELFMCCCIS
jgi:hypothetical protein